MIDQLFISTAKSYKFFWFKAIISLVCKNNTETEVVLSYEDIINRMILMSFDCIRNNPDAFDENDRLLMIYKHMENSIPNQDDLRLIIEYLEQDNDKEIRKYKRQLTENVPYRFLSPYLNFTGEMWYLPKTKLISEINKYDSVPYHFIDYNGLKTEIIVKADWIKLLKHNRNKLNQYFDDRLLYYLDNKSDKNEQCGCINRIHFRTALIGWKISMKE